MSLGESGMSTSTMTPNRMMMRSSFSWSLPSSGITTVVCPWFMVESGKGTNSGSMAKLIFDSGWLPNLEGVISDEPIKLIID